MHAAAGQRLLVCISTQELGVWSMQEGKKASKYTLNLAPGAAETRSPHKAAAHTPKRTRAPSATQALDFHDAENNDPFSCSQELVARR